jgi:fructose-bisphosphate aldolase, class I
MDVSALNAVAKQMVAPGKGILAADESTSTIGKRFDMIQVENTEPNRQAYREMLFTAPGLGEHISGVIMYDETLRQSAKDGRTFVSILEAQGVLPGIKVDEGLIPMDGSSDEKVTKGLDGLPARLKEYAGLGAKFAKWRNVITIGNGLPTDKNIEENARIHAEYARMCQEASIVPIVEPEVLMDGGHDIAACRDASERALVAGFEALKAAGVAIEGMILKTNMVVPGKENRKAPPEEVAKETVAVFKQTLPDNLPGQAFLSGGQGDVEATENLNAINKLGPFPWSLSFSYGRALQDKPLKTWAGKAENVPAAQQALLHRAKMNGLAMLGQYDSSMEKA